MKGFRIRKGLGVFVAVTAAVMLLALAWAPQSQAAEVWKKKYERFSATAGESLSIGDVVCIKATDGKAYKADADDSNLRPAVGLIDKGGSSAATVEIVVRGILAGQTAASPGKNLYLSTTAGAMTTTVPTNEQCLGWVMPGAAGANSSTTYLINVTPPQNDGAGY